MSSLRWIVAGWGWVGVSMGIAACGDDSSATTLSGTTVGSTDTGTETGTETGTGTGSTGPDLDDGSGTGGPPTCAMPIEPVPMDDARLSMVDGRFVDAQGRDVVMRGLNTGGRSKFAPFLPFTVADPDDLRAVRAEADVYFGRLAAWGLDTVRMPFSWEALEPVPGDYDQAYLDRYQVMLDAAWALRLRVIVDFHQDVYASPFCGDGFPPWSVPTPDPPEPTHDCPQWFVGYFANDDVRESFDRFWANTDGLQAPFAAMWTTMAESVADHPAVVGLEPMNEPGWGTADDIDAFKLDVLEPWYEDIAAQLTVVAPEAIIFYDGPGIDATGPVATHIDPAGDNLAYAPHLYDASLLLGEAWAGVEPTPAISAMGQFGREAGVAVLLGEFGFSHGARGGNDWLTLVMDGVDTQRMSATLWEYSTSTELWNGEDLSVTEPDGTERPILDGYVRPWLRAVAGEAIEVRWDRDAGVLEASWTAAEGVTEVVVPARLFPEGPQQIELTPVDGTCSTWDEERGELRITAPPGAAVNLVLR